MDASDNRRVLYVEFHGRRPFHVVTDEGSHYDFEWCKRDKCLYYDEAGSADPEEIAFSFTTDRKNRFWAADGIDVRMCDKHGGRSARRPPAFARLARMPAPYTAENLFGLAHESRCSYCSVCEDHLPWEDYGPSICDHQWWSDSSGWWVGAGSDYAGRESYREHVLAVLEAIDREYGPKPLTRLPRALRSGRFRAFVYHGLNALDLGMTIGHTPLGRPAGDPDGFWADTPADEAPDRHERTWEDGVLWLLSLDRKRTHRANVATAEWVEAYLAGRGDIPRLRAEARERAAISERLVMLANKNEATRAAIIKALGVKKQADYEKLPMRKIRRIAKQFGVAEFAGSSPCPS